MSQSIKNLSRNETKLLMTLSGSGKDIFSFQDAFPLLKMSRGHAWKFIHTLIDKGWLKQIEKGKYLIVPLEAGPEGEWSEESFVIASHLIKPYVVSYWSALNYYGYTEQIPRTVFVASTKRKFRNELEVLDVPYKFITLVDKKFFGIDSIWIGDKQVNITDKEKTLLDCLDHPEYCGGIIEAAKGLHAGFEDKVDFNKLARYAEKMGSRTIFKRLGYLAETLKLPLEKYLSVWRKRISSGYSLLDPTLGKSGKYNSSWNLRLNISKQKLTSWRTH